ncbi:hypothetical protein DFP72DRAFT_898944 [Ephemerocybe angulata]|uniref:Uncharacterized protein n=1 Tax=Ephemerocybe angulata TaxID=980116 RepID=A0A8H6HZ12_9AGAR|nr:hypothetical protein DFP72DRAFT_898944 [Tulosesus angulatus]
MPAQGDCFSSSTTMPAQDAFVSCSTTMTAQGACSSSFTAMPAPDIDGMMLEMMTKYPPHQLESIIAQLEKASSTQLQVEQLKLENQNRGEVDDKLRNFAAKVHADIEVKLGNFATRVHAEVTKIMDSYTEQVERSRGEANYWAQRAQQYCAQTERLLQTMQQGDSQAAKKRKMTGSLDGALGQDVQASGIDNYGLGGHRGGGFGNGHSGGLGGNPNATGMAYPSGGYGDVDLVASGSGGGFHSGY